MPIEFKFDERAVVLGREMCEANYGSSYQFDKYFKVRDRFCLMACAILNNLEAQGWRLEKGK